MSHLASQNRRHGVAAQIVTMTTLIAVALCVSAAAPASSEAKWLGRDLISSAAWRWNGPGYTLEVTPTRWARIFAGNATVGAAGWNELYDKYKDRGLNTNLNGMRDQFICHQQFVAVRSPRKPTWNLDEWRPDVSYEATVRADCNPEGGGD